MRRGILRLLAVLSVGSCLSQVSVADTTPVPVNINPIANDQVLPWPWAMQCPFPWGEIDGNWVVTETPSVEGILEDRFEFKTEYVSIDGMRFFEVKRFDSAGNLLARGRGFSPEAVKLIRVAMIEVDSEGRSIGNNYWAFVGSYQQDSTASCSANVTTVITLRSMNNFSAPSDIHYVVSKAKLEEEVR